MIRVKTRIKIYKKQSQEKLQYIMKDLNCHVLESLDELHISGGALRKQALKNECETVSIEKLLTGYDV